VRLSATEERISQKVAPRLAACGFEGAWARDLARDCAESEPLMRTTLARLAQRGELHQVVRDLFYDAPTMHRLAALAREVAARQGGEVTAADFRDATRLGRKRAIQILEHFDRVGLLRRVGDVHRLRADCTLFAQGVVGEGPENAVKGQ
jgi:selenocysteine-specific elongation factor